VVHGLLNGDLDPRQLWALTHHSPDIIMVLDLQQRIEFINWTAPGLTIEGVLGTSIFAYVPAEQHEEMNACFTHVRATGTPGSYRNIYVMPGGMPTHWESVASPVTRDGELIGFTVFSRDVSERNARGRELDEFFDLSLDFLCIADFDGYFTRVNPTFMRVLGHSEQDLLSRPFLDWVHPEDIEGTLREVERLGRGLEVVGFENRYRTRDGRYRVLAWQARADVAGKRMFAVARDVTEQRGLEAQLRESQKMNAIGKLAGGVAHDFNNLMLVVLGNSQFVAQALRADQADVRTHVEEIERAGQRAADLTRQLLQFSRREPLTMQIVDLNDLYGHLLGMLRRLIPENITLELTPSAGPATVEGDPGQLEQVLMNLCLNARDAMPAGGLLKIRIDVLAAGAAPPGRVLLTVTDNGLGMTEDTRERLFEPFFTTKEPGRGTGLGLSIAYAIVRQHGGDIRVSSALGKGSTFEIAFPAAAASAQTSKPAEARAPSSLAGASVLVVEDEEQVRRIVVKILEHAGHRVRAVSGGQEAIGLVRDGGAVFDLALLDVVMPGLSGPETHHELLKYVPNLPAIFCSGHTDRATSAPLAEGQYTLLAKPYTREELLGRVHEVLSSRPRV
jgi:PAS domain S-box-containing protein